MASGNGSWSPTTGSGNRGRLEWRIDQSPSKVGSGTSSVSLRLRIWVRTRYSAVYNSISWSVSGSWSNSGTKSIDHGGSGGRTLLYDGTITVSTSYSGTVSRSFTARVSGIGVTPNIPNVSKSHTVGRRPISVPAAPSKASAVRQSDSRINVSWTRNATTARPYSNQLVQRRLYNQNGWSAWKTIATVSRTATSYADRGVRDNRTYEYRLRSRNAAGTSGVSAVTSAVRTTPMPPADVVAKKLSGGDIRVEFRRVSPYSTDIEHQLQDNPGGDGWVTVATQSGSGSFVVSDPDPSKTHQYRVRTRSTRSPALTSGWPPASNTVQLLGKPDAPTPLKPDSVIPLNEGTSGAVVRLTWQHNPIDTTDQTAYEVRVRRVGGSSWTTYDGGSDNEHAYILLHTDEMEWQVRTKGDYPEWSDWSPVKTFRAAYTPNATITEPPEGTLSQSRVDLVVEYNQTDDVPQARVQAELLHDGVVLETLSWSGTSGSSSFREALDNETEYTVRARVQSGDGIWSEWDDVTFVTEFPSPVRFDVEGEWDLERGSVDLTTYAVDTPVIYEWTGTPNESTSTRETDDGTVTNLFTNPDMVATDGDVVVWENLLPSPDPSLTPGAFTTTGIVASSHGDGRLITFEEAMGAGTTTFYKSTSSNGHTPVEEGEVYSARGGVRNISDWPVTLRFGMIRTTSASLVLNSARSDDVTVQPGEYVEIEVPGIELNDTWNTVRAGWVAPSEGEIPAGTELVVHDGFTVMEGSHAPIIIPTHFSPDPDLTPKPRSGGGSQLVGKEVAGWGAIQGGVLIQSTQWAKSGGVSARFINTSGSSRTTGVRVTGLEDGETVVLWWRQEEELNPYSSTWFNSVNLGVSPSDRDVVYADNKPGEQLLYLNRDNTDSGTLFLGFYFEQVGGSVWLDLLTITDEENYEGEPFSGNSTSRVETETLTYQRRDTPDSPWVTLADGVDPGMHVVDPIPMMGEPEYRIISHTDLPSAATGPVTAVPLPRGLWPVYINTGLGFEEIVALHDNTQLSQDVERGKTRHKRAGRAYPVTKWGTHRDHTYTLTATVSPDSPGDSVADVQALEDEPYVACYRDVLGHKHFVTIDNVSADVERDGRWNLTVPMTREDYDENTVFAGGD